MPGIMKSLAWSLFASITLVSGLPTPSKEIDNTSILVERFPGFTIRDDTPLLQKRITSPEIVSLFNGDSMTTVDQGKWEYMSVDGGSFPAYIGTQGLQGCVAVAICNLKGCVLGHFIPDTEENTNARQWEDGLTAAFEKHGDDLKGAVAIIAAADKNDMVEDGDDFEVVSLGELEYKWQANAIRDFLSDKDVESQTKMYDDASVGKYVDGEIEEVDQSDATKSTIARGTVLVEFKEEGQAPQLYVAGRNCDDAFCAAE